MLTIQRFGKLILEHSKGFVLVIVMISGAMLFDNKEIILPELAALSIGGLVYKHPEWVQRPFLLFFMPTVTAVIGYGLNMLPVSLAVKLMLVLMLIFVFMRMMGVYLAPALATGLLPIITNCTSWIFVYSILIFMSVLALAVRLWARSDLKGAPHERNEMGFWVYLFFLVCWLAICNALGRAEVAAIPPVIVVGFEVMHKKKYSAEVFLKQVVILSLAALAGACSLYFLVNPLVAGLVDLGFVFFLLQVFKAKLPPAYAMSLLPMVIQVGSPWVFGLSVFLVASVILSFVYCWKRYAQPGMNKWIIAFSPVPRGPKPPRDYV
jgi:hypothetical protein